MTYLISLFYLFLMMLEYFIRFQQKMVRIYMYIHVHVKIKSLFKHEFEPYPKEGIILAKLYVDTINI